ncbi:lytic transglycosylase domain-containing protein [Mangrovibacterium marinum]|uniref:Transglycosylase-like protein with SLT domain n=1 Tax=Mangrovibacterium marinum TaxID=1639118 RepID=A0A2T5C012_9BACT|nr:lytic transglycosylase domain-containing protein [Mangrovibacterium marinum]PTN07896.1 transglycosylase-like protein with SLT domain [Mangrovibacterium marinum]
MRKIVGRSLFSLLVLVAFVGCYYFLQAYTVPKQEENPNVKRVEVPMHGSVDVPSKLTFMGEPVPLEYFDVRESLDRELLVNANFHSQTLRFLKLAPRYMEIIKPILKADTVPEDFAYLALAESGFNEKALSPAGAVGFWQFMKGTATDYGLEINPQVDERYHLEKSTKAACEYLKDSYRRYGSWTLVAASYNAGRNHIDRQLERQKVSSYYDLLLGEETSRYVFRILALKLIMENPRKYGFDIRENEVYPRWRFNTVTLNGPVASFADFAKEHGTNYKILKMLNPWLRDDNLINSKRKTYTIKVPAEGFRTNENN